MQFTASKSVIFGIKGLYGQGPNNTYIYKFCIDKTENEFIIDLTDQYEFDFSK